MHHSKCTHLVSLLNAYVFTLCTRKKKKKTIWGEKIKIRRLKCLVFIDWDGWVVSD